MTKARIDSESWCRCGKCGRKMFYIKDLGIGNGGGCIMIEIKCHSCREVNEISLYA